MRENTATMSSVIVVRAVTVFTNSAVTAVAAFSDKAVWADAVLIGTDYSGNRVELLKPGTITNAPKAPELHRLRNATPPIIRLNATDPQDLGVKIQK